MEADVGSDGGVDVGSHGGVAYTASTSPYEHHYHLPLSPSLLSQQHPSRYLQSPHLPPPLPPDHHQVVAETQHQQDMFTEKPTESFQNLVELEDKSGSEAESFSDIQMSESVTQLGDKHALGPMVGLFISAKCSLPPEIFHPYLPPPASPSFPRTTSERSQFSSRCEEDGQYR